MTLQSIGGDRETMEQSGVAISGMIHPPDAGKRAMVSAMDAPDHLMTGGGIHIGHNAVVGQAVDMTSAKGSPQQAHISNIITSIDDLERAKNEMAYPADLPPLGDNIASRQWREMMFDTSKHNIHSNLVASNTAACGIYISPPTTNGAPNYLHLGKIRSCFDSLHHGHEN